MVARCSDHVLHYLTTVREPSPLLGKSRLLDRSFLLREGKRVYESRAGSSRWRL